MRGQAADPPRLGDVLAESDASEVRPHHPRPRPLGGPRPARAEPVFWLLFSGGGMVAALLFPVTVLVLGVAFGAGWLPEDAFAYERMLGLVSRPITRVLLWGVISLPLFHWAHRFRYIIHHQIGVHGGKRFIALACYGAAVLGTAVAAVVLLRL